MSLLQDLKEISEDWGVEVVKVEIQSVVLPEDVMQAMHELKSAEQKKFAAEQMAMAQAIKIDKVREAADKLGDSALQYLYLQALEKIAEGRSNKIIFPIELTHLAERLAGGTKRKKADFNEVADDLREKYDEVLLEETRKKEADSILKKLKKQE